MRAIWVALCHLLGRRRRTDAGRAIAAEYRAPPQDAQEVGWPDEATAAMIAEEPW